MKKRILKFKSNTDTDSSLNNNQTGNQQNIQFESNYKNLNHAQPKEVNFNQMHEKQINTSNTMQVKSAHLQKHNNKKQFETNEIQQYIHSIYQKNLNKNQTKQILLESQRKLITPEKTNENINRNNIYKAIKPQKNHQDIDELVSLFVPEYKEKIAVELKNVSLSFKISNDKIDNLKEYVIKMVKKELMFQEFLALQNVSLQVRKGEAWGIVGTNGSGKSTLLKLIGFNGAGKSTILKIVSGVYDCDEGEVTTNGIIAPLLSLGAGFDYNYSGKDNIFLNGAILGYTEDFLKSKYDEILEFSELEEFINFPVKNYSSGMLAKLGFSIATVVNPDILIIDEILSVGDVKFQKKSNDKIKSLMGSGTTVLLVSHSIQQIRNLCDKALWINKGKVVAFDEVNKVCDAYLKAAENANKNQLKNIKLE